ncbi:MAG TPA: protease, partial [Acidobacteriaceae bacterium]
MFVLRRLAISAAAFLCAATLSPQLNVAAAAENSSAQLLLRSPSLSQSAIAFRYADDIWTVARTGGAAERLTSEGNVLSGPYYSPDGGMIAYSARVHGNEQIFTIPAAGGIPKQITWHPAGSTALGWTPDGKEIFFSSMMESPRHYLRIYKAHADGSGLPEMLPLPMAFEGNYSPDGQSFAYEPV